MSGGVSLIIAILLSITLQSQNIEVSVVQDVKLAIMADDYNNKPYTADLIFNLKCKNKITMASFSYEMADLQVRYNRVSAGFGGYYRYKCFEIGQTINIGNIIRPDFISLSWGADTELSCWIKRFRITGLIQTVQRTDIGEMRYSIFLGLGCLIN